MDSERGVLARLQIIKGFFIHTNGQSAVPTRQWEATIIYIDGQAGLVAIPISGLRLVAVV
jgi:hypothetical protein